MATRFRDKNNPPDEPKYLNINLSVCEAFVQLQATSDSGVTNTLLTLYTDGSYEVHGLGSPIAGPLGLPFGTTIKRR